MNAKIVMAIIGAIVLMGLGCMDKNEQTLIGHRDDGFYIIANPPEGMTARQLADNIHCGNYDILPAEDTDSSDRARKGFEVSSYVVYEDYRDHFDGIDKVVAQGGRANITYDWGYSPLAYEDGAVHITVLENVTIKRL